MFIVLEKSPKWMYHPSFLASVVLLLADSSSQLRCPPRMLTLRKAWDCIPVPNIQCRWQSANKDVLLAWTYVHVVFSTGYLITHETHKLVFPVTENWFMLKHISGHGGSLTNRLVQAGFKKSFNTVWITENNTTHIAFHLESTTFTKYWRLARWFWAWGLGPSLTSWIWSLGPMW